MAVQLWPHKKHTDDPEPVPAGTPAGTSAGASSAPADDPVVAERPARERWPGRRPLLGRPRRDDDTVVVRRRRWEKLRRHRPNPISRLAWAAGVTAALILIAGIFFTWINANQANGLVHTVLVTGNWLATPFRDLLHNPDARVSLYQNWGIAAAVYYVAGRLLSWLTRW